MLPLGAAIMFGALCRPALGSAMCAGDEADLCSIFDDLDYDPVTTKTPTVDEDDLDWGPTTAKTPTEHEETEIRVSAAVPMAASLVLAGVGSKCAAAVALLATAASSVPSAAANGIWRQEGGLQGRCAE